MNESRENSIENEPTPEEAIELARKVSILMTKPENTDTEVPILLLLKNKGFKAETYRFTVGESELSMIYPEMSSWPEIIQKATKDHLLGNEVEVFLVSSDEADKPNTNVLNELKELRGESIKPEDNPSGTLRREFYGSTLKYTDESGKEITYYENGFHCPQTPEELIANLKAFGLLSKARGI